MSQNFGFKLMHRNEARGERRKSDRKILQQFGDDDRMVNLEPNTNVKAPRFLLVKQVQNVFFLVDMRAFFRMQ